MISKRPTGPTLTPSDGPFNWVGRPSPFRKHGVQVTVELENGRVLTKRNWPAEGYPLNHANAFYEACKKNLAHAGPPHGTIDPDWPDFETFEGRTKRGWRMLLGQLTCYVMKHPTKANMSFLRTVSYAARAAAPLIEMAELERRVEALMDS